MKLSGLELEGAEAGVALGKKNTSRWRWALS